MTVLAILVLWVLLAVVAVTGLALLFTGRDRWRRRAEAALADAAPATAAPSVRDLPLAG